SIQLYSLPYHSSTLELTATSSTSHSSASIQFRLNIFPTLYQSISPTVLLFPPVQSITRPFQSQCQSDLIKNSFHFSSCQLLTQSFWVFHGFQLIILRFRGRKEQWNSIQIIAETIVVNLISMFNKVIKISTLSTSQ